MQLYLVVSRILARSAWRKLDLLPYQPLHSQYQQQIAYFFILNTDPMA